MRNKARNFPRLLPPIPFTKDGYEKIKKELEALQSTRPNAVLELQKGREMGDLSENGYYKAARAKLSFLDGRIRYFTRLLKQGRVVETADAVTVQFGSSVTLLRDGVEVTYQITGEYESDPGKGTVSRRSPLGAALLGKRIHDTVSIATPKGTVNYTIVSIK